MSETCQWCDEPHAGVCPRVSAFSFHEDGTVESVSFWDQTLDGGRAIIAWLESINPDALDVAISQVLDMTPGTIGEVALLALRQEWSGATSGI